MSPPTSAPPGADGREKAPAAANATHPPSDDDAVGTPNPAVRGPRTVAIIVHWGPTEPTLELAHRLEDMPMITEVVVVANDGTSRPDDAPAATGWLVPGGNLGFAGGFRFGADARPDTDVYLLLNNDVRLPEQTVAACLDLAARDGVGIVGPTLVNGDGIQPGPDRLTPVFTVPRRRRRPRPEPEDVAFVPGAILFVRAECHRQVPMDTRYFLYYEETDLARRAAAAGWRVMLSPYQAWHTGGGTIPGNTYAYYCVRNRLWFARVHGRPWQARLLALWLALAALPRYTASDLLRGHGLSRCPFQWRGLLDGIGPLPPVDSPLPDEPRPARWQRTGTRPRAQPSATATVATVTTGGTTANVTARADAALADEIRVSLPYPRAATDVERRTLARTVAVSRDAAPAADKV